MQLIHFSDEIVTEVKSTEQTGAFGHPFQIGKPDGFWISVEDNDPDDGWHWWTEAEHFGRGSLAHEVTLKPDARILHLDTIKKMDRITRTHGRQTPGLIGSDLITRIDWQRIARKWQGVLISPYHWSRRLELRWYYPWDCASGCIWDADAIQSITPLPNFEKHSSDAQMSA